MYPQVVTKENIEDILLIDIDALDDQRLVELRYSLRSIWDNIEEFDSEINTTLISQKMREIYYSVLSR